MGAYSASSPPPATDRVCAALLDLRAAVRRPRFALSGDDRAARLDLGDRVAKDLDGQVARLRDLDAPLLVVFGGVTGAGKSTVVNTLVGRRLVATGVRRPTTFAPTLVVHPDDAEWFTSDRVLGTLGRVEGRAAAGNTSTLQLARERALPPGLAVIDAPDTDSISEENRDLADGLLDAADLWVWFTTAGKYADAESMRYLQRAHQRRTALAVALTLVRAADRDELLADFRDKLAREGLGEARVFVVGVAEVHDERLPDLQVDELRGWLWTLAGPAARRMHRRQTLDGALDALPADIAPLVDALEAERRTGRALTGDVERAGASARAEFVAALDQGLPLQQEVLNRWNRFVGTGRLLKLAEEATGQARSWIRSLLGNVTHAEEQRLERDVRIEVADTVTDLVVQLADLAGAEIAGAWSHHPAGRELLHDGLASPGEGLRDRAEGQVRAWQDEVVALVATRGADRRVQARWASTAINAAATGAIVIALAQTGGLTGAEAGIATAAGAANQTLLVKLLGAANLRWLVSRAKEDLTRRFDELMADELRRFTAVVDAAAPGDAAGGELRDGLAAVALARGGGGA